MRDQASDQAAPLIRRNRHGQFLPGCSGNPKGRNGHAHRTERRKVHEEALFRSICRQIGRELDTIDIEFARQIAAALALAWNTQQLDVRQRALKSAYGLFQGLKGGHKADGGSTISLKEFGA